MEKVSPSDAYNTCAQAQGWAAYADPTQSFDRPNFLSLLQMWRGLAVGENLPKREALTPRLLKAFLPDIGLFERVDTGRWRARLLGTRFARVYGDFGGEFFDEVMSAEATARVQASLDETLRGLAPFRLLARTDTADKNFFSAEYCNLPLADSAGRPTLVLSCAYFAAVPWEQFLADALARRDEACRGLTSP
ncbi:MAG TPA: PAS domain-containing protein [Rhizomicrobium sp.]|jgi:hypothetical protein